jgi:hypothetical protein
VLSRPGRRLAAPLALLLATGLTPPAHAQDQPVCDPSAGIVSDCKLDSWPEDQQALTPSPFGTIEGAVWLEDPAGDAPPAGLDVQAVGIGSVEIADAAAVRDMEGLLKAGKVKQAVRPGRNVVVRVVLDRPLSEVIDGHAGVHVVTDIDRSRSNNAPAGIGEAEQPFAGSEDVYSVTFATTTGQTRLLDTDLAEAWYRDRDAFAAAWADPAVLDLLVRPERIGDEIRVVTFTDGPDGGYDTLTLGIGAIPVDGEVGLRPTCLEASILAEPFVIRRLVENGQTLRDVEAPASWRGGAAFALDEATRGTLEPIIQALDADGDGVVALASEVALFEGGAVIGQRPDLSLSLDGDRALLGLELGLARRGYEVLRAIDLESTGDEGADAWLAEATDALVEAMPPFRAGRRGGTLVGDAMGACVPALGL